MTDDFNTPEIPGAAPLVSEPVGIAVVEATAPVPVDNNDKTDELSIAVAAENVRNAVFIPEPVQQPCKYQLEYFMDGKKHTERHVTVDAALASVRRLRVLNIIPATSTL